MAVRKSPPLTSASTFLLQNASVLIVHLEPTKQPRVQARPRVKSVVNHTSICDKTEVALTANGSSEGVFPMVLVKVDDITTRALVDSGSNSSYVSAIVADMMRKKPSKSTTRRVEMLMGTHTTKLELYDAELSSIDGEFKMDVKLTKVNKTQLLTIPNPQYEKITTAYPYLKQVSIVDRDTKDQLPIRVILGVGDYAKIKTNSKPLVGKVRELIAELT